MSTLTHVDGLLRGEGIYGSDRAATPWRQLFFIVLVAGAGYGAVMGSFGARPLQVLLAALKVPVLVAVSTAVCLPNFFIVQVTLGLRDDFTAALRGIVSAQATFALTLVSLAPITALGYLSGIDYDVARLLNGAMFLLGLIAAQITLGRHYRPLIRNNPRHRRGLLAWFVLYVFVAIQLAWVLRPFIGDPALPTRLFRESAWGNAYLEIFHILMGML